MNAPFEHSTLAKKFWAEGRSAECPIYDMHGHMGPHSAIYFPRVEPEAMIRTMDACGVRLLCFSHHTSLHSPDLSNSLSIEAVRRFPTCFRAYCTINPNYPEIVKREVASFESLFPDVYVGFKFLSDYHKVALIDPRYEPAWAYADEHGHLVLAHTWGGSPYDGEDVVREVASRYPNVKLLLGHSCHGAWDAAIMLTQDFPNIYLELTAVFDDRGVIERFVDGAGSDRMLFGTDLPWFDPHHAVGVLMDADITDADRHNICHRNAERLLRPRMPDLLGEASH